MTPEEKLDLCIEAIKEFHRVYYSIADIRDTDEMMRLHHAAEHVFNCAEIASTLCERGRNAEIINSLIAGHDVPQDAKDAWKKAKP